MVRALVLPVVPVVVRVLPVEVCVSELDDVVEVKVKSVNDEVEEPVAELRVCDSVLVQVDRVEELVEEVRLFVSEEVKVGL